jgi:hypothetical protein
MNEEQTIKDRMPPGIPPTNGEEQPPIILDGGVIARNEGQVVRIIKGDVELFRFPSMACPFAKEPLSFLLQVYSIGYLKGRTIGAEVTKARIREMLGAEL